MSDAIAPGIRQRLERKEQLSKQLASSADVGAKLTALRRWQAQRLDTTYADLRAEPQYLPAMFVLTDALELELLTLELDASVAAQLRALPIDESSYAAAYRAANRREARARQIDLVVGLARRLSELVRHKWIGAVLRLARAPAQAAGFAVLQSFLERGFAAFAGLRDVNRFIATIETRERALMERLFVGNVDPFAGLDPPSGRDQGLTRWQRSL